MNQANASPQQPNPRPVQQFADIDILESRGDSTYHSLQARFQQSLSRGQGQDNHVGVDRLKSRAEDTTYSQESALHLIRGVSISCRARRPQRLSHQHGFGTYLEIELSCQFVPDHHARELVIISKIGAFHHSLWD